MTSPVLIISIRYNSKIRNIYKNIQGKEIQKKITI